MAAACHTPAVVNYTDEQRLTKFQETFHTMASEDYWPDLRRHGRVDRVAEITFHVDHVTGQCQVQASTMTDAELAFAGPPTRKFTSAQEPVFIPNVLDSARALELDAAPFDEAQSQWKQVTERRFPFLISEGRSVGMKFAHLPGKTCWWEPTPLGDCTGEDLALVEFAEVYYNEQLLHAFEQKRNEDRRAMARTVPKALARPLCKMAVAATLYSATLIHAGIAASPERQCPPDCPEQAILRRLAADGT